MEYGFVCQRCQTVYITETTPDDAANALDDLREKGCGDCGGHAFGIADVVRDSCTGVDADCECGEHWSPAFMAQDSFRRRQLIEADTGIRQAGMLIRPSLPFRQPAPHL
jgi:hypothetical protein